MQRTQTQPSTRFVLVRHAETVNDVKLTEDTNIHCERQKNTLTQKGRDHANAMAHHLMNFVQRSSNLEARANPAPEFTYRVYANAESCIETATIITSILRLQQCRIYASPKNLSCDNFPRARYTEKDDIHVLVMTQEAIDDFLHLSLGGSKGVFVHTPGTVTLLEITLKGCVTLIEVASSSPLVAGGIAMNDIRPCNNTL